MVCKSYRENDVREAFRVKRKDKKKEKEKGNLVSFGKQERIHRADPGAVVEPRFHVLFPAERKQRPFQSRGAKRRSFRVSRDGGLGPGCPSERTRVRRSVRVKRIGGVRPASVP